MLVKMLVLLSMSGSEWSCDWYPHPPSFLQSTHSIRLRRGKVSKVFIRLELDIKVLILKEIRLFAGRGRAPWNVQCGCLSSFESGRKCEETAFAASGSFAASGFCSLLPVYQVDPFHYANFSSLFRLAE